MKNTAQALTYPALEGEPAPISRRRGLISPLAVQASESVRLVFWLQWLAGMTVQLLLFFSLAWLKNGQIEAQYHALATISVFGSIPFYAAFRAYSLHEGYLVGLGRLMAGWLALIGSILFLGFVTKTSEAFSREVVLQWMLGGYVGQALSFLAWHSLLNRFRDVVVHSRRSIIVGTEGLARAVAKAVAEPILGMIEVDDSSSARDGQPETEQRVIGGLADLRPLLARERISRVYIALPTSQSSHIEKLYLDLLDANVDVIWVPDFSNLMLLNHRPGNIGGLPALHLNESPMTSRPGSALLKSASDKIIALLSVIVLAPLLLGVAIAVKISSPGPVFFRQQRHGWNGAVINVLKFRSMYLHEDSEVKQAEQNDPRVTPIGRFIRRTSIDELPQLFNVLKGEMSLVGPRPHAIAHNNFYSQKIIAYMARHRIKPGITGHAQINGYRGETATIDRMQRRVELDLEYINNWSLWLDIKILIKTPLSLFSKRAY